MQSTSWYQSGLRILDKMMFKLVLLLAMMGIATARPGFLHEPAISYASHYGPHFYDGHYDLGHSHHVLPPAISYQSSTIYHTKPTKIVTPVVAAPIVTPVINTYATPVVDVSHYPAYDQGIYSSYDSHGWHGGYGGWKSW